MEILGEYVFVNRKSKPHLRRKAKDHGASSESVHLNKLQSRYNFGLSAHINAGKRYTEFIDSVRSELVDKTIREDELPVIDEAERAMLMYHAIDRGIDPNIIDEISILKQKSPIEILFPARKRTVPLSDQLSIIAPFPV